MPGKPSVRLDPMTDAQYVQWRAHSITAFAQDKQKANGYAEDQALALSNDAFEKSLPEGIDTPDHHLFSVTAEDDQCVGFTWLAITEHFGLRRAFIYDIEINEDARGKGYGRAAMKMLEKKALDLGVNRIGLHVFRINETALALYQSLGYETTDITMEKHL